MPGFNIFDMINHMNVLPIDGYQKSIEAAIEKNPVVIITAETGAGKSTRVPFWQWKRGKKVLVTQPRRIAARSLSYYLSQSTLTKWGQEVGYQTGFDRKFSSQTRLLYLTDGVQMVKEIKGQRDYDVLILDEVHEWNLNQEILIGLVKKGLDNQFFKNTGKRVVIMSATLHYQKLSIFLHQAPVISVPGRGFPVTIHHNQPDFILSDTVQMIEMNQNILVFQPGKGEIDKFISLLKHSLEMDKLKAKILPLHSELSIRDQARVFLHYPVPKVIVATDIAQTSLTIDDIDAVIDTGVKKEVRVVKGIEGLYPTDISNSECLQRAGRAGRVKNGQYILCSDLNMKDRLPYPEPEIRRLNLESVVLRLIKWGLSPLEFPYFHPSKKNLIYKAIKKLKVFGAISDDEKITSDGEKMAEIPVSIRSSRLLLEAQKSSPRVVDSALKLIAILETKGIVNKEYLGEKYYSEAINSDLLNQLILWNNPGLNRKSISFKKLALAKEVYRELKKRMDIKRRYSHMPPHTLNPLIRVILSAFVDHAYSKIGKSYGNENEERELDRTSVLYPILPEAIVGMPFDLVIDWENPNTGEKEKKCLSLITFATELSIKILNDLRPYSYENNQQVKIEKNQLTIENTLCFGEKTLFKYRSLPDWSLRKQKNELISAVIRWVRKNKSELRFYPRLQETITHYDQAKRILSSQESRIIHTLSPFEVYWLAYLEKELKNHLKSGDLKLFFNLHPGLLKMNLKQLLPYNFIQELKKMKWPEKINLAGTTLPVSRIENKPFIKLDFQQFEKIKKDELVLPTGEKAGIIIKERKYPDWDIAVYHFNRWKKRNIFETKWKHHKKKVRVEDVVDIPFPIAFNSGQSKQNTPFEFHSAPKIIGDEVVLIHFFEKEQARSYFEPIQAEWDRFLQAHKKQKIDDIFKKKGWKVK